MLKPEYAIFLPSGERETEAFHRVPLAVSSIFFLSEALRTIMLFTERPNAIFPLNFSKGIDSGSSGSAEFLLQLQNSEKKRITTIKDNDANLKLRICIL